MRNLARRQAVDPCLPSGGIVATLVGLVTLALMLWDLAIDGLPRLSVDFFLTFPSRCANQAGILSAWVGSSWS